MGNTIREQLMNDFNCSQRLHDQLAVSIMESELLHFYQLPCLPGIACKQCCSQKKVVLIYHDWASSYIFFFFKYRMHKKLSVNIWPLLTIDLTAHKVILCHQIIPIHFQEVFNGPFQDFYSVLDTYLCFIALWCCHWKPCCQSLTETPPLQRGLL